MPPIGLSVCKDCRHAAWTPIDIFLLEMLVKKILFEWYGCVHDGLQEV